MWLEIRNVKDSILGAISPDADDEEKSDIMGKKTTFFGSEIRRKIKDLGVVKSMAGEGGYGQITKSIDDGITVGELIKRLES